MRFSQLLHKQHIGRAFRSLWQQMRERPVLVSKADEILTSMGFTIQDPLTLVQSNKQISKVEKIITSTEVHPDWKDRDCLTYKDSDLLQEGVSQACLLTKTLQVENDLPKNIKDLITDIPEHVDNLVKRIIYASSIYDAEQVKLPKLKDPARPSWVFPRVYGISSIRKMHNLSKKFLQLCESLTGTTEQRRALVHNGTLCICIDKEWDLLQFSFKMDLMTISSMPLTPLADVNIHNELAMPNLYPLHHSIGLLKTNIYKLEDIYPITTESSLKNIHTIFINYDPEEVKNITELPTTETQIHARSMLKSFTAAAACARQRYGSNVKELPDPVVVQCIQSDGQNFHFSVYQLNTLDIDGTEGIRNFWWSAPSIKLYEKAQYENGRPYLEGYNNEVFKKFFAFYNNK